MLASGTTPNNYECGMMSIEALEIRVEIGNGCSLSLPECFPSTLLLTDLHRGSSPQCGHFHVNITDAL